MRFDEIAIIAVRGIGLGSVYALVAMSFNIVKVSSGILNFAQGNMVVLGGLLAYFLFSMVGGPTQMSWYLFLPLAAIGVGILMTLQGIIILLPMRYSTEDHSWLITTMAFSVIIGAVLLITQGPNALSVRSVFPTFMVAGTHVPAPYLLTFALAVIWCLALSLFRTRTMTGLQISALWQNPEAARAAGLKIRRLQIVAFTISGLIVGSTGFVAAPMITVSADSGFRYVINGFVAVVIGGMGSNIGALIAGPLVGMVGMFAAYRYGAELQGVATLLALIAILLLRPQGLFGSTTARQV